MRRESDRRADNGGYLHLRDGAVAPGIARRDPPPVYADLGDLARRYAARANGQVGALACRLNLKESALLRLGCGWDGEAWTFPMVDANRRVIGIRRRLEDGRKLSVKGGHEGVFMPDAWPERDTVLICEGPTDSAAVMGLGFEVLGRPSCAGAVNITATLLKGLRPIIVSDSGKPGEDGAARLRDCLGKRTPIIYPPAKDVREWIAKGATAQTIELAIRNAN